MTHRTLVSAAYALIACAPVFAQAPRAIVQAPRYTLVEEWRINAKEARLGSAALVSIGPDGRVVIAPGPGRNGVDIVAFDSTGKTVLWRLPSGWNSDFEIRYVNRVGWTGPQLWISDPGYDQIALVDARGKVTKSIEVPSVARPTLGERRKFPVFASMEPLARYVDGSMLIRPLREKNVFDTPEFDSTATHLLRVSSAGIIGSSVARYTPERSVTFASGRVVASRAVPMQNRTLWAVSPDGMRISIVSAVLSGKDSATMHLVMLDERGDTVYRKRVPFTTQRISDRVRDSALAAGMRSVQGHSNADVRAAIAKEMPPVYPPIRATLLGRDRSTWITLTPSPGDSLLTRLILDPAGEIVGTAALPRRFVIAAADREHAWAIERQGNEAIGVIRYRLVRAR